MRSPVDVLLTGSLDLDVAVLTGLVLVRVAAAISCTAAGRGSSWGWGGAGGGEGLHSACCPRLRGQLASQKAESLPGEEQMTTFILQELRSRERRARGRVPVNQRSRTSLQQRQLSCQHLEVAAARVYEECQAPAQLLPFRGRQRLGIDGEHLLSCCGCGTRQVRQRHSPRCRHREGATCCKDSVPRRCVTGILCCPRCRADIAQHALQVLSSAQAAVAQADEAIQAGCGPRSGMRATKLRDVRLTADVLQRRQRVSPHPLVA